MQEERSPIEQRDPRINFIMSFKNLVIIQHNALNRNTNKHSFPY